MMNEHYTMSRGLAARLDGLFGTLNGALAKEYNAAVCDSWRHGRIADEYKRKMNEAGQQMLAKVRRLFRRVLGRHYVYADIRFYGDGYTVGPPARGTPKPCKCTPLVALTVRAGHVRMDIQIETTSARYLADQVNRVKQALDVLHGRRK